MVGTSWRAARSRAGWPGAHRCRFEEMPRAMPIDHAPELAALAKRLADAKEFL